MKKAILISTILVFASISFAQTADLKQQIERIISDKKATVGVAVLGIENGDTFTINNAHHYPMQSVFKFHLGLAVLNAVDKGKFKLDQKLFVSKKDLVLDMYSPLREKYPKGDTALPLKEILSYTVSESDNTGCDFLFQLIGGPTKVNHYIHSLGIQQINIVADEATMHKDDQVQYTNWTTPLASVQLLEKFYHNKILSKESTTFMWQLLTETSTGTKRLKGLLPTNAIVAHKTGSSGIDKNGLTAASNDIGIVTLPNGKHFAIAVFVSDSSENIETNELIIAEISKAVWERYK